MAISFKNRAKSWSRIWHANVGIATALTLGAIALSCPFIAHKGGDIGIGKALMQIHYGKFLPRDWQWVWIDAQGLALFFLIGSGWLIHHRAVKKAATRSADDPSAPGGSVTILWDGESRGAETAARSLAKAAEERGMRAFATEARRYETSKLPLERWLVCVLGEGGVGADLPLRLNGEKLSRLEFAVVGSEPQGEVRCHALSTELTKRGAKAFLASGHSDPAGAIVAHLAQHVKLPQTPKTKTQRPPALAAT